MKKLSNTKLKDMKAITLIALVITIVVLIILAGVIINLSLGDNGIFNRTKTAKEQYQNAQDYEETQIAKYSNEIDSYVGGNRDYTPISYSTNEQDTGMKWIDGKKIWQKTWKNLNIPITVNGDWHNTGISISSIKADSYVSCMYSAKNSNNYKLGRKYNNVWKCKK